MSTAAATGTMSLEATKRLTNLGMLPAPPPPPLDFSFQNVSELDQLHTVMIDSLEETSKLPPRGDDSKYETQSIRLCNNKLTSAALGIDKSLGITKFQFNLNELLKDWKSLSWVDLSFNLLTDVPEMVSELPNLSVLYLHANQISKLSELKKLEYREGIVQHTQIRMYGMLNFGHTGLIYNVLDPLPFTGGPKLRSLTLHGNPISEKSNYKMHVVCRMSPTFKSLDFTAVTKLDKAKALEFKKSRS